MRSSRFGLGILMFVAVLATANCGYYNRIVARKNLVDGAAAYKNRKFQEAESLFRDAVSRDPNGATLEGKTAQVFLARTLHSTFIGKRSEVQYAENAIKEYQKALKFDPSDQSSFKAVANLYENLQKSDEWLKWETDRANDESIAATSRAEAFVSLAAKKNSCANDISDTEAVKKKITKDGKPAFQFVKPAKQEDYDTLKKCAEEGLVLSGKAVELDPNSDSAWSYQTSLLVQNMRLAEMDGKGAEAEALKTKADAAKEKFTKLAEEKRKKQEAEEAKKAEEAAAAAAEAKKK